MYLLRETHLIINLLIVVAHLYFKCNTCTSGNGVKKLLTKRIHWTQPSKKAVDLYFLCCGGDASKSIHAVFELDIVYS